MNSMKYATNESKAHLNQLLITNNKDESLKAARIKKKKRHDTKRRTKNE